MYDAVNDPYTYEGSTVLRNLLDLRKAEELDAFEAQLLRRGVLRRVKNQPSRVVGSAPLFSDCYLQ
jgi:hypothetical protein